MRLTDPSNRRPHPHHGPQSKHQRPSSQGIQPSPEHPILPGFQHPPHTTLAKLASFSPAPGNSLPLWGQEEGRRHQAGTHHQSSRTCPAMQTSRGRALLCVSARTHHAHTLCTQTSINSKSTHNQKCTHTQWMNLKHTITGTRAFIHTQVTYNRHMKQTCPHTAAAHRAAWYTHTGETQGTSP